jgi:hypothetical protein
MIYRPVSVELNWITREGRAVSETTATLQVGAGGAIVLVEMAPPLGAEVRLTNTENNRTKMARIAGMRPSLQAHTLEVALEFQLQDETFWELGTTLSRAGTGKAS